jgi:carboxyl-terminal processing protease
VFNNKGAVFNRGNVMTRGRVFFLATSAIVVASILSGALLGAQPRAEDSSKDSFYKYLSVFSEVLRLVRKAYVDETDLRTLMAGALEGSSDALDPFSMYIPEPEVEAYLEARRIGSSRSGLKLVKVRGAVYVMAVQEGSPATVAGIQRGDVVTKLAGLSTRGMPLWEIELRLAGPASSALEFEILRAGETSEVELVLGSFEVAAPTLEEVAGLYVLTIPAFKADTATGVAELLEGLAADRLLVDLRGVVWGDVEMGYDVAKLFVRGELGSLVGSDGPIKKFTNSDEIWEGEIVVLMDRGSQGAAEVLARALQQGAGARLAGQKSFGFAGHPRLVKLDAGGSLLITDSFYTGPDGEPLDEGIAPDERISERRSLVEPDEDSDPVLDRALELLRGAEEESLEEAA